LGTFNAAHIVNEAEQLLFYSIPGSIFLLFAAAFLFLYGRLAISTGYVAAAAVVTIPIGFLIYQAYTANLLGIYGQVSRRKEERTLKFVQSVLTDAGVKATSEKELYRLSKRVLTVFVNQSSDAPYIWRLIGIINARGACLFSTICAIGVPVACVLSYMLGLFDLNVLSPPAGLYKIVAYYAMLSLCSFSLYYGIPKVRGQLDVYNELLIFGKVNELKALAANWIAVDKVKVSPAGEGKKEAKQMSLGWVALGIAVGYASNLMPVEKVLMIAVVLSIGAILLALIGAWNSVLDILVVGVAAVTLMTGRALSATFTIVFGVLGVSVILVSVLISGLRAH